MKALKEIPYEVYRRKTLGCWLGKVVGGTLGGPWEGKTPPRELTFYDPVPAEMLPNDDLDLQIVWLQKIREGGLPVDRRLLSEGWIDNIHLWPDEYGVCRRNLDLGLYPSLSGAYDNGFADGMGAAIRTEIWACLAPGDPRLAAELAKEDACCDHTGDGIHAAVFLATVESAAFVVSDRDQLIGLGLEAIPGDCRVAVAIRCVVDEWARLGDRAKVLERLLAEHGSPNFTDAPQNLGIIVLGWLAGAGDFGRSILAAVNCGKDADCTCASLGSILGILDPDSIGEAWLKPIGRRLALSPGMTGMAPAATLDELTDQISDLSQQVLAYYGSPVILDGAPRVKHPVHGRIPSEIARTVTHERPVDQRSLAAASPIAIEANYPDTVRVAPGETKKLQVVFQNTTDREGDLAVQVFPPEGWAIDRHLSLEHGRFEPMEKVSLNLSVSPREQVWRPYFSRLKLDVGFGEDRQLYSLGLLMAIPFAHWRLDSLPDAEPPLPDSAILFEAYSHYLDLAQCREANRALIFQTWAKIPFHSTPRFVVQCARPTRLWIDGEMKLEQPGDYQVPAIHRARHTGADVPLRRGKHCLTIAVAPSQEEPGTLFLGIGNGQTWRWMEDVEFQNPLR